MIYKVSPTSEVSWFYLTQIDLPLEGFKRKHTITVIDWYTIKIDIYLSGYHIPVTVDISSLNIYINSKIVVTFLIHILQMVTD